MLETSRHQLLVGVCKARNEIRRRRPLLSSSLAERCGHYPNKLRRHPSWSAARLTRLKTCLTYPALLLHFLFSFFFFFFCSPFLSADIISVQRVVGRYQMTGRRRRRTY